MNEHIHIEVLPVSWFPDLAAVQEFLQGPRYYALSSLALGAYDTGLPEPLAGEARQAGFFVAGDLLELGRYAALSSPETFEAQREDGAWSSEWPKWLAMLNAVANSRDYVETIRSPVRELLAAEGEVKLRVVAAE